jgi:hypothetical protein
MKLAEEEWDQTDTRLAKYVQTVNERRAETVSRTMSGMRSLKIRFPPKICPFLPTVDS